MTAMSDGDCAPEERERELRDVRLPERFMVGLVAAVTANPRQIQNAVRMNALAQNVEMLLEVALDLPRLARSSLPACPI
jgi:hypothetical protein